MLSTLQKSKTETTQATELFPTSVRTEQQSLSYIKRLTAVAVSNVLYLRNVFTEDCYGHRKLDSIKLRILTEKCQTIGAKQIVYWVKGCFDAMEKKYLKQMTLGVYTDPQDPNKLIEAYTFRYTYDNNQINCNISLNQRVISEGSTDEELILSTTQLLRSLIIMTQSLDKLPKECYLSMKLLYYENTPEDYEPPGFVAADNDSFSFVGKPISINAGEVVTPFHSLKVKIRTNQKQFQDFVSTQNSNDMEDNQNVSQELGDDCTPFEVEEHTNNSNCFTDLEQVMSSQMRSNGNRKVLSNTQNVDNSKQSIRESLRESITTPTKHSKKEHLRQMPDTYSSNNAHKVTDNTVISKIRDLSVEDKHNELEMNESNKRKQDFEVTQDSVFNSLSIDKRFKASKTEKPVSVRKRR